MSKDALRGAVELEQALALAMQIHTTASARRRRRRGLLLQSEGLTGTDRDMRYTIQRSPPHLELQSLEWELSGPVQCVQPET